MPLETGLVWASLLYSACMLVGSGNRLLRAKAALVILVIAVCVAANPLDAAAVACAAVFCLIVLPLQLNRMVTNDIGAGRPNLVLCYLAYGAHPDAAAWAQIGTARAVRLSAGGARAEAIAAWDRLARSETAPRDFKLFALLRQRRLEGRVKQFLDEIVWEHERSSQAMMARLSALSELGRVNELIAVWEEQGDRLQGWQVAQFRAVACAALFAATGRVAALERVFATALARQRERVGELYLLQARLAAEGGSPGVTAALERLAGARDQELAARAECILAHGRAAVALSPAQALVVDAAAEREARVATPGQSPATVLLVLLSIVGFAAQLASGGPNDSLALEFGRFSAALVQSGEWWRLGTAAFLHAGWLSFVVDLIALCVLGAAAERMLGRWRLVAVYVAAGLGGMVGNLVLGRYGWHAESGVVGPSGSLLGLLGALLAMRYRRWRCERSDESRSLWHLMVIVVAIQVVLDLAMPDLGLVGHGIGGAIGVVLGSTMTMRGLAMRASTAGLPRSSAIRDRQRVVVRGFGAERPPHGQAALMVGYFVLAVATAFSFPRQRVRALAHVARSDQVQPDWGFVNRSPGPATALACRGPRQCRDI